MKAFHKYHKAALNGDKEAQRRLAQAHGYRASILDNPLMIKLLKRADIHVKHPLIRDEDSISL
tara:strand:+ start:240 stop:428 length:189 start_codon:yes stop_codon:yes gene_type:complete